MIRGNQRWTLAVQLALLVLACIMKCIVLSTFNWVSGDKSLQIAAANSINAGRGYSLRITDPSNISGTDHLLTEWPPLYSVMVAPFLRLTNGNERSAALILECIFGVLGLVIIAAILKKLSIPPGFVILIVWFKALEINEAIEGRNSTDQIALVFFTASLYFTLLFYERRSYMPVFAMSACLSLMALTRYMYLPISLLYAGMLLLIGIIRKDRCDQFGGLIAIACVSIAIAMLFLFNNSGSGQYYYVDPAPRGIFLENLRFFYPVVWQAFGNVHLFMTQMLFHASPLS